MAEREDGLKKLQALLAGFDDRAFEALASKGLLRRARGDLKKGEVGEVEVAEEGGATVRVGDQTVTIPETGPVQATCTCPAEETCRHILVACLHLKAQAQPAPSAAPAPEAVSAGEALLALSLDQISKWAGKKAVREALATVHEGVAPEIAEDRTLVVAFRDAGVDCHLFPGGLDAAIVNGAPPRHRKRWAAAAVFAYQKAHGISLPAAPDKPREAKVSEAALREQRQVTGSAEALMEESVRVGLSNLSAAIAQRYTTLAVSAQGAALHRLALALRSIADEVRRLVDRDAQAGEEKLFLAMAQAYALCAATKQAASTPPADLIGRERSSYSAAGDLKLAGVGAYPWVTRSGYEGLTVIFWDNRAGEWLTWSDVRPQAHAIGFRSTQRYEQPGPWSGTRGPYELARSQFVLRKAKRNHLSRLSASTKSSVKIEGPTQVAALDFATRAFTEWHDLRTYAASVEPSGLRESKPTDGLVVLGPAVWRQRVFDPVSQTLVWALQDANGETVPIEVRYETVNRPCVEALENLSPPKGGNWLLLGSLVRRAGGISIFPVSVLRPGERKGEVLSLAFRPEQKGFSFRRLLSGLRRRVLPSGDGPGRPDEPQAEPTRLPYVAARVTKLEDCLQHLAECGGRSLTTDTRQTLRGLAREMRDAGLTVLARSAEACAAGPGEPSGPILTARYLCHLHGQVLGSERDDDVGTDEARPEEPAVEPAQA